MTEEYHTLKKWARMLEVLEEVKQERYRQDQKYGPEHDDAHSVTEWDDIMHKYLDDPNLEARDVFLKVAAISVAAIEALDRSVEIPFTDRSEERGE